ncbi:MAG: hypothetical protein JXA57_20640 [Armatimonadetes bacterium]|nr:hypothetical protein [Armatimonadota bacterium]
MSHFKRVANRAIQRVPFCPAFDRLYTAAQFCHRLRRLPRHYLYNDRLFWMRWRGELLDPLRQFTTDKVLAKEFIRARVGEKYVVKTFAVLETEEQIRDYVFPQHCVVKPAHGCAAVVLCRDGVVDRDLLASWLRIHYYRGTREQNYAFLRPRVLVEEFALGPDVAADDYRLFCVDGEAKVLRVTRNPQIPDGHATGRCYSADWVTQPVWTSAYPPGPAVPRPENLDEMLAVAAALSRDFPLVRIDLYTDGTVIKVGEITHCQGGGGTRYLPENGEALFSELLFEDALSHGARLGSTVVA